MKTFQEFLTEVFDAPLKFKMINDRDNEIVYSFNTTEGKQAEVAFVLVNDKNIWDVAFHVDYNINITGGGESLKIFSTVIKIIFEFVRKYKPSGIDFSADKETPSRLKLYRKFVQKFASQYNYKVSENEDGDFRIMFRG